MLIGPPPGIARLPPSRGCGEYSAVARIVLRAAGRAGQGRRAAIASGVVVGARLPTGPGSIVIAAA